MGNFLSHHATYCTKEDVIHETPEQSYEKIPHRVIKLDPRSPTAEIVRTPIQILTSKKQEVLSTPKSSLCSNTADLDTPVSIYSTKAIRSSDVDLPSLNDLTADEASGPCELDNMLESIEAELLEIENSLNPPVSSVPKVNKEKAKDAKKIRSQKLNFSPEKENIPKSVPKKTRTPLAVRSSNTPAEVVSPATFLRQKQQRSVFDNAFQKYPLSQRNAINCENTPPRVTAKAATLPRKRPVEWDKDATMII